MREKRIIKKPKRYGEWEEDLKLPADRVKEKLWEVEDITQRKGSGVEEMVLVKWAKWEGPMTWVNLSYNQELRSFLEQNKYNPHACTLIQHELGVNAKANVETDLDVLKQAIFDNLSEIRYTPDGSLGKQIRVTLKVPFRKSDFELFFRPVLARKVSKSGNVECYLTVEDMDVVFGDCAWRKRTYKTSTETFISGAEYIHLTWGYKERTSYDHAPCKRCHWEGEESERPELCNWLKTHLLGPPWLHMTFTRARRNVVTGSMSRKRRANRK